MQFKTSLAHLTNKEKILNKAMQVSKGIDLTKSNVLKLYNEQGYTVSDISRKLDIPRSTVSSWVNKAKKEVEEVVLSSEVSDILAGLAPINLNIKKNQIKSEELSDFTVVIGCIHFGVHCNKTLDIFYQVITDLKPSKIILNGDIVDLLAVSKYPKDVRHNHTLQYERESYAEFIANIYTILGSSVEIVETNANHSGDGVESRWWRYLSDRIGEIATIDQIRDSLSYKKVFIPTNDFISIDLVDNVKIHNDLYVMHGDVVRAKGGESARGMIDKWQSSVIMNHTHRIGMTAVRIPSIGGRVEKQRIGYEVGCACDLNPVYATAPNWQNGFAVLHSDEDGTVGFEQVVVINGKATCLSTGYTYTA